MAKRMFVMLVVMGVFIGSVGYFKSRQMQAAAKTMSFQPPPAAVTTTVARQEIWPATLNVVGSVAAVQGVTISADLPGTVAEINFDSGKSAQQGAVLVTLDTRQERAQLAAMEAQRDLAKVNQARMEELSKDGIISKMDYDKSMAEQKQMDANVQEIRATIDRKTIRAPFSGVLGIRQVNLGQYLAAGSAIVPLQSLNPIYVNFSVPQQVLEHVRVGDNVGFTADDVPGREYKGRVNAIDSVVDEATRNVQVQAILANPDGKLHPGMFVRVQASVGAESSVIPLPASAINYAPFGDSVFIVSDITGPDGKSYRGVRQQFVKVEGARGDQVGVLSGIKPGDEVVSSGVFKLRNGAAVAVNNQVQPGNNPAPKPQDN
jgi:membrane fusion protein (multidrug efflux system)